MQCGNICSMTLQNQFLTMCFFCRCNNDSFWSVLVTNGTEISMETHQDNENTVESQVIFKRVEETVAIRCIAKNDLGVVARELKLVAPSKY